jgi:hypothetical protein
LFLFIDELATFLTLSSNFEKKERKGPDPEGILHECIQIVSH